MEDGWEKRTAGYWFNNSTESYIYNSRPAGNVGQWFGGIVWVRGEAVKWAS